MVDKERNKGEIFLYYHLETRKKKGSFDILNNISEHVILVQLMNSFGNANHSVSLDGKWIFLILTTKTLSIDNLIIEFHLFLF